MKRLLVAGSAGLLIGLLLVSSAVGQDLAAFEKKTTTHVLDNGWTFIIVERPIAPVFTFATLADVGGVREVPGITGLAHMFEHMAFKGTPNIGTSDYKAERVVLDQLEDAYKAYQTARMRPDADAAEVEELEKAFKGKEEEAGKFVVNNEFGDIISREGGVGLNAGTGSDSTVYFYSLPANKVELFCYLESERFLHPVFREFYKERDVVQEERRLRTESNPIGRLIEQLLMTAFTSHPYHQPVVGYMSDLHSFTMTDAKKFFDTYYVPANLVTAVVGDVNTADVIKLVDKYFGRIPKRPRPAPLRTVEPPQVAEKVVTVHDPSQPFYIEAYHKAAQTDPDQPVFDAIDSILSSGRTSRMYKSLVEEKQLAVNVGSQSPLPGGKYPNLWLVLAIPAKGKTNEEVADAIHEELDRLKNEDVTDEELQRFKTQARANLVRRLGSNGGLANQLVSYQTSYGDWRELFHYLERLEAVTKADIRRVAQETLKSSNRTVAQIVTESKDKKEAAASSPE